MCGHWGLGVGFRTWAFFSSCRADRLRVRGIGIRMRARAERNTRVSRCYQLPPQLLGYSYSY